MEFFNVISLGEAKGKVISRLGYIGSTGMVAAEKSLGRVTADDLLSPESLPAYHKSTVDGYALRAQDTYAATDSVPAVLKLVGKVEMGRAPQLVLAEGEAAYVPTGGLLPDGADSVAAIEDTQNYGGEIAVFKRLRLRENALYTGEDIQKNAVIAPKGSVITPMTLGLASGAGVGEIAVFKETSFFIISTGDELSGLGEPVEKGKIRDINTYVLSALAVCSGHKVAGMVRVKDDLNELMAAMAEGARRADIVLVSGGSSIGERDYTCAAIKALGGEVFVKGIAMKPGKPTVCGTVLNKVVFGLPGHPMAAAIVYKMLVSASIKSIRGQTDKPLCFAEAECNFPSSPGRLTCQAVKCTAADGKITARPLFGKSGTLSPLAEADGFIIIPENAEGVYQGNTAAVFGFTD